jgi:prepilin-type N-terminal cleavage/methylation domain-containing protein
MIGALRRALRDERGMSLSELVVVMMVTAIVLAAVATFFTNIAIVTTNANAATSRTNVAANIMNEMSKVIRTSSNNAVAGDDDPDPAIVSATASALTVYSYVDTSPTAPAPTKVTFRVDATGIVFEDRIKGTLSGSYYVFTGATTTRNLGGPIVATSLFTYLDTDSKAVPIGATGLTPVQRDSVASIKVEITIANNAVRGGTAPDPAKGNSPIILSNTIGMPNLLLTGTDN